MHMITSIVKYTQYISENILYNPHGYHKQIKVRQVIRKLSATPNPVTNCVTMTAVLTCLLFRVDLHNH